MTDLIDKDKRSLFHAVSSIRMQQDQGPWIIEHAEGVTIRDRDGREIIDCGAGLWVHEHRLRPRGDCRRCR